MNTTTQLPITYRDYTIKQGEHTRYEYIHNEYDGPEDTRLGFCSTLSVDDVVDYLIK